MLTRSQVDKKFAGQALKAEAVTPAHAAAEGEMEGEPARRRRERVQHLADPYPPGLPEVDEVDLAELGKRYSEAVDVPVGYPALRQVHAEEFRKPSVTEGHAAYSPGYETPGRPVPVPSETLSPGMLTRDLLTDGRARPGAPEAC